MPTAQLRRVTGWGWFDFIVIIGPSVLMLSIHDRQHRQAPWKCCSESRRSGLDWLLGLNTAQTGMLLSCIPSPTSIDSLIRKGGTFVCCKWLKLPSYRLYVWPSMHFPFTKCASLSRHLFPDSHLWRICRLHFLVMAVTMFTSAFGGESNRPLFSCCPWLILPSLAIVYPRLN